MEQHIFMLLQVKKKMNVEKISQNILCPLIRIMLSRQFLNVQREKKCHFSSSTCHNMFIVQRQMERSRPFDTPLDTSNEMFPCSISYDASYTKGKLFEEINYRSYHTLKSVMSCFISFIWKCSYFNIQANHV